MFGYKYKLVPVNPDKNIVKLTPTLGTYVKAFAPAFVLWGGIAALVKHQERQEQSRPSRTFDDKLI
jgi:hypothetical protein